MRAAAAVLFAAALTLTAGPALAQPGRVTLSQPAPIAKDAPSLPRIVAPATPATAKVNAALARADARFRTFDRECRADAASGPVGDADVGRATQVTMRGPVLFSVIDTWDYFCGGAHPDVSTIALVYDLDAGRPVSWLDLLPASLHLRGVLTDGGDGSKVGTIASPALQQLYLKAVRADRKGEDWTQCAGALQDPELSFMIWPDPAKGGVVISPFELAHVVAACGDEVTLPTAQLRRMGASARLTDAIDAAQAGATRK